MIKMMGPRVFTLLAGLGIASYFYVKIATDPVTQTYSGANAETTSSAFFSLFSMPFEVYIVIAILFIGAYIADEHDKATR